MSERLSRARGSHWLAYAAYVMLVITIAFHALILMACFQAARAEPVCYRLVDLAKRSVELTDGIPGAKIYYLDAGQLARYAAVLREEKPDADLSGDGAFVISAPGYATSLAVLRQGQACGAWVIGPDLHERALKAALGDPA